MKEMNKLLKKMTVDEKVAQLCTLMAKNLFENGKISDALVRKRLRHGIGSLAGLTRDLSPAEGAETINRIQSFLKEKTRLGIPAIAHEECLHGCMARGCTIFPQAIGLAACWDLDLFGRVAAAIGDEARSLGFSQALTPVMDVARDPRCGRTEETYGEDTWMVSRFGVVFVKALQKRGVACTPKHFAANFVGEGGRDSNDVGLSEHTLREVFYPPYEACIREAGALSIMPSYNSIDGMPNSCNSRILKDLLRDEWKFKGITGSDYWAINGLYTKQSIARDAADAARLALEGGMDVEWPDSLCYPHLVKLVKSGKIPMKVLDQSVARVLFVKQRLGLFLNPFARPALAAAISNSPAHRQLAREAAAKSLVLLSNRKGALPLGRISGELAVIGPNANTIRTGGYSSTGSKVVTPLAGLKERLGADKVLFAQGCTNTAGSDRMMDDAVRAAGKADAAVLVLGNWSGGSWKKEAHTEGEGRDRCDLSLPGRQEELIDRVCTVNRRVIVVLIGGSAVTMERWVDKVGAVLQAWYPGCEGGNAIADALFGDVNPGGRLPLTFPRRTGQLPLYYNIKPTGRASDYTDLRGAQALFPFGHGLSYTEFKYSGMKAAVDHKTKSVTISFTVKNTGRRTGDEVVQLYSRDVQSTLTRPVKELKGFGRVTLAPGRSARVEFRVTRKDLSYLGSDLKPVFEPGEFSLMLGSSSEDIRLTKNLKISF